jgi:hypothetical protein
MALPLAFLVSSTRCRPFSLFLSPFSLVPKPFTLTSFTLYLYFTLFPVPCSLMALHFFLQKNYPDLKKKTKKTARATLSRKASLFYYFVLTHNISYTLCRIITSYSLLFPGRMQNQFLP